MKEYRVTIWDNGRAYCYRVGLSHPEKYKKDLMKIHNRFKMEEA